MVISKFQNSFSALQAILRYPNSFLGTINDSGILHCTQTIKIINYSVIKCQKNGAKMNKIVQKWQFQKIFYTTMETVLGFSQNRLAELFQNYVFSTNQYLYFDLYVAECQIQFFWLMSWFGVYVLPTWLLLNTLKEYKNTYLYWSSRKCCSNRIKKEFPIGICL